MLEKTLESPLDSKEIKLVNPRGNQSWIFIRRTDTEAPIIWPPDAKRANSLEKTLILGMIEDRRRRWWQSRRWLDSIIDSTDMNLTKLQEIEKDREACVQQFMGSQRVVHNLVTEEQQQVQFSCSVVTAARQASLSITNSRSLLRLMSIVSVMPSNHRILCCPLLLLPSVFHNIRAFPSESALIIRWPKYCSFSFTISPANEYSGLISFRMDWFDLLAVQGTLKSLFQHHSSKASILRPSDFFIVQLSGKITVLTRWTCVSKVMSLLFNMLSRLVITFLPRNSIF